MLGWLAGQNADASANQRKQSALTLSVLHGIVGDIIHRAGPDLLARELPPKVEHVLQLRLSPLQEELYAMYQKVGAGSLSWDAGSLL